MRKFILELNGLGNGLFNFNPDKTATLSIANNNSLSIHAKRSADQDFK